MFQLISQRLSDTEHVRESARKMEEHTDLFSQFGMVLKTRSRATECSDNYMMSAVAYFEVGDYESAARCFSKADMALMMHRDILEKWGKFQNFLHQVARNKQGLCELPDGWFDMDIMTQFLDLFGEFQALPNALKTAYSL